MGVDGEGLEARLEDVVRLECPLLVGGVEVDLLFEKRLGGVERSLAESKVHSIGLLWLNKVADLFDRDLGLEP